MTEENPFVEDGLPMAAYGEEENPFSSPVQGDGKLLGSSQRSDSYTGVDGIEVQMPKSRTASNGGAYKLNINVSSNQSDVDRRLAEVERREKALEEREAEVAEHQAQQGPPKNWPLKCYPIVRHSIQEDIQPQYQRHMKLMYAALLGTFATLGWSWLCTFIIWVGVGDSEVENGVGFIWASLYLGFGVYGSWHWWYMRIYNSLATEAKKKALRWMTFKGVFGFHIIFCAVAAIGLPKWGMSGYLTAINGWSSSGVVGTLCFISALCWTVTCLGSVALWKRSATIASEFGVTNGQAKAELVSNVMTASAQANAALR